MPKHPALSNVAHGRHLPAARLLEIITETAARAASETTPDTRARRFTAGLAGALADIAPAAAEPIGALLDLAAEPETAPAALARLRAEIDQHARRYYNAEPIISDAQFDAMMHDLQALEARYPALRNDTSPTQRIGAPPPADAPHTEHRAPMLSINTVFTAAEVRAFDERIRRDLGREQIGYSVESKLDGVAISARYRDGVLTSAATRGDGKTGIDVTRQVIASAALPRALAADAPAELEVRGELHQPIDAFDAMNDRRHEAGQRPLTSPRGAASGALRLADDAEIRARGLAFAAFDALCEPLPRTHAALLEHLTAWGFSTPPARHALGIGAALEAARALAAEPGNRACDGVVIKVADLADRHALGTTARAPCWAIALKEPAA